MSTAFLSMHYVLIVRYNWKEQRMRRAEIVFFTLGFIFPLGVAIGLAVAGAMHPTTGSICWINNYLYTCWRNPDPFCEEANSDWIWNLRLYLGMLWIVLALVVVIVSMILLYITVRYQEQRMSRYYSDAAAEGRRQKQVMNKAFYT